MLSAKLVKVYNIKLGDVTTGNEVETSESTVALNPNFIVSVETLGNGDNFKFYKKITMSNGQKFNVDVSTLDNLGV